MEVFLRACRSTSSSDVSWRCPRHARGGGRRVLRELPHSAQHFPCRFAFQPVVRGGAFVSDECHVLQAVSQQCLGRQLREGHALGEESCGDIVQGTAFKHGGVVRGADALKEVVQQGVLFGVLQGARKVDDPVGGQSCQRWPDQSHA